MDRDDQARLSDAANEASTMHEQAPTRGSEELVGLFTPEDAASFRSRWTAVQSSFVNDPQEAVREGDELVGEVLQSLSESFKSGRSKLEAQLEGRENASTEELRLALRRYRSFFERLLRL